MNSLISCSHWGMHKALPPALPQAASEIKVTPKMILAGVLAYYEEAIWGWDNPGNAELREMLSHVFKRMASAQTVKQPCC